MSLQFNPGAYESAFQYGQNRDDQRRQQFEQSLQAIPQSLAQIANIQQQKKKDLMDQLTLQYQADANARENRKFESEYGTPINPNSMEGLPTGQVGQSSFMPGGQGPVATGSPLIKAFEQWRANGMQGAGARPEFMGALAKDERKAFYDQNDPKNLAEINLKNAQAEYYRNRPTDPVQYTIPQLDASGNVTGFEAVPQGMKPTGFAKPAPLPKGSVSPTALSTTLDLYEEAKKGLLSGLKGTNTGPIFGRVPAFTSNQQIAEGSVAAMAPVLKQLFRVAGEGTFTDRDQALLLDMVPTRKTDPRAIPTIIGNIDNIVKAKLGMGRSGAPQDGSEKIRVRNKLTGQTGSVSVQYFDPNKYERIP